ncbi:hypothetical protein DL93DRAFT_2156470 [Clavulina sp. PMI_390]|nr:hypothetical protein DL93DRAFT_2156470 [Clavulina sp. PMI_390]
MAATRTKARAGKKTDTEALQAGPKQRSPRPKKYPCLLCEKMFDRPSGVESVCDCTPSPRLDNLESDLLVTYVLLMVKISTKHRTTPLDLGLRAVALGLTCAFCRASFSLSQNRSRHQKTCAKQARSKGLLPSPAVTPSPPSQLLSSSSLPSAPSIDDSLDGIPGPIIHFESHPSISSPIGPLFLPAAQSHSANEEYAPGVIGSIPFLPSAPPQYTAPINDVPIPSSNVIGLEEESLIAPDIFEPSVPVWTPSNYEVDFGHYTGSVHTLVNPLPQHPSGWRSQTNFYEPVTPSYHVGAQEPRPQFFSSSSIPRSVPLPPYQTAMPW